MNFKVLWLFAKASSIKCGGTVSFGGTCKQFTKFLLRKNFSHKICQFSPHESFPLYEFFKRIAAYKLLYR